MRHNNKSEYSDTRTHWIALHAVNKNVTYFDRFSEEHVLKKIFIKGFSITTNIYIIQPYDSVMCGFFCFIFIDFMLNGKSLKKFDNLFSSNNFQKMKKQF